MQHLLLFTSASLLLLASEPAAWPAGSAMQSYEKAANHAAAGRAEAAIDSLEASFHAGLAEPMRVLSDARFESVRRNPDTRRTLRTMLEAQATSSKVAMVAPNEPGDRMEILATVVDRGTRRPVAGAVVYLYQTDSAGLYVPEDTRSGIGSDNPRLFAWVRTDVQGRFTVHTVHPGSYPGTRNPRHVHYSVEPPNRDRLDSEFFLDGDPEVPAQLRREAAVRGWPVIDPMRRADGTRVCNVTIELP